MAVGLTVRAQAKGARLARDPNRSRAKSPQFSLTERGELVEFVAHRRRCGRLTGDAAEPTERGYVLTVACSCGVTFERRIMVMDARLAWLSRARKAPSPSDPHSQTVVSGRSIG
jgi:hypothetical protein